MATKLENIKRAFNTIGLKSNEWALHYGFRVWTRCDGRRYKDMDYLTVRDKDVVFDKLCDIAADVFDITDEFKSSPVRKACIVSSVVYILDHKGISVATKSIFRNSDVWRRVTNQNDKHLISS